MEPFQLTLNQVNFEEKDLSPTQTLHSFSNLVNYDSDFKEDDNCNKGVPITTRQFSDNHGKDPASFLREQEAFLAEKQSQYSNTFHTISVVQGNSRSLPMDKSTAIQPSKDSFKAFTETVEALALQKSVIGGSNIKPASAEEIAKAIAEAQAKIAGGQGNVGVSTDVASSTVSEETEDGSGHTEIHTKTSTMKLDDGFMTTEEVVERSFNQDGDLDFDIGPIDSALASRIVGNMGIKSKSQIVAAVKSSISITQAEIDESGAKQDVKRTSEYEALQANQNIQQIGIHKTKSNHKGPGVTSTKVNASRKVGLVRIKPQDVTTVTERSTGSAKVVPSEKIKPANFPTSALSLIRPQEVGLEEDVSVHGETSSLQLGEMKTSANSDGSMLQSHDMIDVADLKNLGKGLSDNYTAGNQFAAKSVMQGRQELEAQGAELEINGSADKVARLDDQMATAHGGMHVKTTKTRTSTSSDGTDGVGNYSSHSMDSVDYSEQAIPGVNNVTTKTKVTKVQNVKKDKNVTTKTNIQNTHTVQTQNTVKVKVVKNVQENLKDEDVYNFMATADAIINDAAKNIEMEDEEEVSPQIELAQIQRKPRQKQHYAFDKPDLTVPDMKKADFKLPDIDPSSLKLQFSEYSASKEFVPQRKDSLVSDATYDSLREELTRVLKENAKLEGQLEMLGLEARIAIKERAELQAQVAGMKSQLQAQSRSASSAVSDRDALESEIATLRQNHSHLEKVIINAQRVIENKDVDNKALQDELQLMKDQKDDSQDKIVGLKKELAGQESKVVDFKNKITELYVEFQMSNQARILAENEMKSLQSEIKSLQSSQNWYQEQLKQLQDGKTDMQDKIANFQTKNIESMTLIERLKAENVRIKQQLTDAQQKALNEKNVLAHHLEVIEADMIEREAAFAQLQQQRLSLEQLVNNEEAKAKQIEEMTSLIELQEEISKLKNENRRRQAQVSVLEHEQTELVKRLTLSQESILDRDKTIDEIDKKLVELQLHCQTLETDLGNKNNEVGRLNNLNSTMEDDLKAAKEQKVQFDAALSTLKEDMVKVEQNFKKMKNDLAQKEIELNQALSERKTSDQAVEALRSELAMLTTRHHQQVVVLQGEVERQQAESEKLQQSALPQQEELSSKNKILEEEKAGLITNLNAALEENRNLQKQWQDMHTELLQTTSTISATTDKCTLFEKQLLQSQQENAQLQCQLTELQSASEELSKLRVDSGNQQAQLSRAVEEAHAYKQRSHDLEKYAQQQQEVQRQLEERMNTYVMQLKEFEIHRNSAESGYKVAMDNLQQRSEEDRKTTSEYITSLEAEISNLKTQCGNLNTQCNDWQTKCADLQTQLKSSAAKLEEYDLLQVKVKSLEQHVQHMNAQEESKVQKTQPTAKQDDGQEREDKDREFVTLDAHIEEVNALRVEIQSLNTQQEEMEAMKQKLKFLEGEQFTVDAVTDELEETKIRMQDMQMEIDEWKKVVEVMQNSGIGDDDDKENVKSEVDLALQQMKKLHDMEMDEIQQKLAEKEEILETYQKSGDAPPLLTEEDPDSYESQEEESRQMTQEELLKLMHRQSLTVEQIFYLITSLGFTPAQLVQKTESSSSPEENIQRIISSCNMTPDQIINVLNSFNLTAEQLLLFIKSKQLPQEEMLKLMDFTKMDQNQINVIIPLLLAQSQLLGCIQSLDLPADQLLAMAQAKGLTEENILNLVLNIKLSEEHFISLVRAQNLPQEKVLNLVQTLNLKTEYLLPLIQSQQLSNDQLKSLLQSQNISQDVVQLVQSKTVAESAHSPEQQVGGTPMEKAPEVHKQQKKQAKEKSPTWEQVSAFVKSPNLTPDQMLQLLMAMNVTKEVLFGFMQTRVSEELLFALVQSRGLSQEHLMVLIQHYGLAPEHFVSLLHSQQLPLPNIVALLQSQNLTPDQLNFLIHQTGMTEERMVEFIKTWNLPTEKLIALAQMQGISLELMLSLVQAQNLSPEQLAGFVHSLNLSQDIAFSLVQSKGLAPEQFQWLIQKALQGNQSEDVLKALNLSFKQIVLLIQNRDFSDAQRLSLVQNMDLSNDAVFNLVQSKGLSQEQVTSLVQQQQPDQNANVSPSNLTPGQLSSAVQNLPDEQRLELVKSLNLSHQSLTVLLQQNQLPYQQMEDTIKRQMSHEEAVLVGSGQNAAEAPAMVHAPNAAPKEQMKTLLKSKGLSVEDRAEVFLQDLSEDQVCHIVKELKLSQEYLLTLINITELVPERVHTMMQALPQEQLVEVVKSAQLPQEVLVHLVKEQIPQEQLVEVLPPEKLIEMVKTTKLPQDVIVQLAKEQLSQERLLEVIPQEKVVELVKTVQLPDEVVTRITREHVTKEKLLQIVPKEELLEVVKMMQLPKDAVSKDHASHELTQQAAPQKKAMESLKSVEFLEMPQEQLLEVFPQEKVAELVQRVPLQEDVAVRIVKEQVPQEKLFEVLESRGITESQLIHLIVTHKLSREKITQVLQDKIAEEPDQADQVAASNPEQYLASLQHNKLSAEQILTLVHSNEVARDLLAVLIPSQKLSRQDFEQFIIHDPHGHNVQGKPAFSQLLEQQGTTTNSPQDVIIEMIENQELSIEIVMKLIQRLPETQTPRLLPEILRVLEKTQLEEKQLIEILRMQNLTQEQLMHITRSLEVNIQNIQQVQVPAQEVAAPPHGLLEGHLTVQSEGLSDEKLAEFFEAYKLSQDQLMKIIRSQLSQEHLMHMLDNLSLEESQKIAEAETQLRIQSGGTDEEGNVSKTATTETTKHLTFALNTLQELETELKTMENMDKSRPLSDHWNKISNMITLTIKCVIEVKNVYKCYIEEKKTPSDEDRVKLEDALRHFKQENEVLRQRMQQVSNLQIPQVHSTAVSGENGDDVAHIMAEVAELRKQLDERNTENEKLRSFQFGISKAVGLQIIGQGSGNIDGAHSSALIQLHRYIEELHQQNTQMEAQISVLISSLNNVQDDSQEKAVMQAQIEELQHMAHLTQAAKLKLEAAMSSVRDTCGLPKVTQITQQTDTTVVSETVSEIRQQTNKSLHNAHQSTQGTNQTYSAGSETDSEKEIRRLQEHLKESKSRNSQLETQLNQVRDYIAGYFNCDVSVAPDLNEHLNQSASLDAHPGATTDMIASEELKQSKSNESYVTKEFAEQQAKDNAQPASGDGSFKYYDKNSNSFDRGITHLIQSLEINNEIKQFLHKELSVIIYENHQVKKSVYDEKVNEILQQLVASTNEISRLKEVIKKKDSSEKNSSLLQQQITVMEEELADLGEQKSQLELILQEANKSVREMSEQLLAAEKTHNGHVEKTTEAINQWQHACNIRDEQLKVFHTQILELQADVEARKAESELQKSEMSEAKNLALDLEKERGRLAGVMQSYNSLKDHAQTLESALAQQESSVTDLSSTNREELERRNKLITQMEEKVVELEEQVLSEKNATKDVKKQLMTEKGSHIKTKRLAEAAQQEQKQNKADSELARQELEKTMTLLEESREKERSLTVSLEDAKSKIQALQTEIERLRRELSDKQGKDPIMQEKIKTLEWELSQKNTELEATQNRVQLIEDRKQMELVNIQKALQTSINDVKTVRDELTAVKQEKMALQAKVAELRANLEVTSVQNKVFQFQKKEIASKEEITSVGASVASPEVKEKEGGKIKIESKPLSFLQDTLMSLRGEISNLQLQVDEHTCAVQSSSQAWKDLEVQVKDLRQLCKTSAADRTDKTPVKKREPPPMVHLPMLNTPELNSPE